MSVGPGEQDSQGTGPVDNSQGQVQDQGTDTGINPAWNELLSELPSSLHNVVTPHLQKWDKNYQEGIGKVHSEYEPWKPFIDNGFTPDQVNYGLQLLDTIQNDPQRVYEALAQHLGVSTQEAQQIVEGQEGQQGLEEQGQNQPIDIATHPQFQQMSEMVNTMAQLLVQQNSQNEEIEADEAFDAELKAAHDKHGDFDERYVIMQMLANEEQGMTLDQAVQSYKEFVNGILSGARKPGPTILSPGGQTPSGQTPPSQLEGKDRRAMVAAMLQSHAQQAD
jgi:hypothetical protein